MRILFLTQIIPYPPDAGPRVKTWHVVRYLAARGHQIILVSFTRPEEQQYIPAVQEICAEVHPIPIRRSRLTDAGFWLRSNATGRPYLVERDDLIAMRHCVEEILATRSIDFIHADQLTMTQFAPFNGAFRSGRKRPLLVFDAHNAVWTIVQRMESNVPWFLRPILKLETKRVMLYEGEIVEKYDHTLAVTDVDRQYLLDARNIYLAQKGGGSVSVSPEGRSVTVVPIAVDTEQLQPVIRQPDPKELFTMGTLHYPPNADGIRWFAREVFPLIQEKIADIHLTIAGRNPPPDIRRLGEESGGAIKVTGFVPDLRPYLERSAAMVVPVRAGSGMRVRILEAFARAIPVVTTSVGLEGIDAKPGEDVLVADTAVDFAASVINLLDDQVQQTRLAQNGRMLAESRYDWKVILKKMDVIYGA